MNAANKPVASEHLAGARLQLGENLLERIGSTPLLRLERFPEITAEFPNVEFFAKAEWFNPGGSVKDRAAFSMIRDGERRGALRPGKMILDATSGNTGIAYAMIGAALGYNVKLCLPSSASPERKHILKAYGVEIVITPGDEGTDGAIRRVREIFAADREKYFYPDQYSNPANPAGALQYDCSGNLAPDRRPDHPFRRGARHQRHIRRHHAPAEGIQSDDSLHQFPAGLRLSRPGRPEAHGHRHRSAHLRCRHSPTKISPCAPKTPTKSSAGSRAKRGFSRGVSSGAALCACMDVARRLPRGRAPSSSPYSPIPAKNI